MGVSYLKQTQKMGRWKIRAIQKKGRASQESGRKKGLVPPQWAKLICRRNRSWKLSIYSRWNEICDGNKIKWSKA